MVSLYVETDIIQSDLAANLPRFLVFLIVISFQDYLSNGSVHDGFKFRLFETFGNLRFDFDLVATFSAF